ncbi:single-strand DNA-binding protein [Labrenzia sp. EL_126]|nr:single-strand DNA-binding protein [Labrenzia sp. EL_126]
MSGSLNCVQLIGNLGADPEIRKTQTGMSVAVLRLATSDKWKDKATGEQKERTEWHRVVCWNEALVGVIEQYTRKGSKLFVQGELQTRKWQDQQGVDRYSTEVVMTGFNCKLLLLNSSNGGFSDQNDNANRPGNSQPPADTSHDPDMGDGYGQPDQGSGSMMDDEIPF